MGLRGRISHQDMAGALYPGTIKGRVPYGASFMVPVKPLYVGTGGAVMRVIKLSAYLDTLETRNGYAWAMAVDNEFNLYRVGSSTITKYNPSFEQAWQLSLGDQNNCVWVGQDGFIYVGSNSSGAQVKKVSPEGSLAGTLNAGSIIYGIVTDADNNIYCVGTVVNSLTTRKLSPSGTVLWSANHGGQVNSAALDDAGNLYTVGNVAGSQNIRKYSAAGGLVWSRNTGSTLQRVCFDPAEGGSLFICGNNHVTNHNLFRYDLNGNLLWSFQHLGAILYDLTIGDDGLVYVAGGKSTLSDGADIRVFDKAGNQVTFGLSEMVNNPLRSIVIRG